MELDYQNVVEKATTATPKLKIAIQGVHGAFHEIAARSFHPTDAIEVVPADTFAELVRKVETGETLNTPFAKIIAKAKFKSSVTTRNINTLEKMV